MGEEGRLSRMTSSLGPGYERPSPWLHAAVAVVAVATFALVALNDVQDARLPVGAALAVFLAAWALFGRRTLNGQRGWVWFMAIVMTVVLVGTIASPNFASFQTIAYPLAWLVAPDVRRAIPVNIGIATACAFGYAISTRDIVASIVVQLASIAFSLGLGVWISRIAQESKDRQRLLDELTVAQDRLASLSRESGVAAERERLARELHDTIAQSLTGIVMLAERARARHPDDQAIGVLEEAAREALTETRGLVAATAPVGLDGGLVAAVDLLARRFERETGVLVTTEVTATVPRGLEVVLLRCAQEGLANVRKHANARSATVRIRDGNGEVTLTVDDDGVGFKDAALDGGFGLAGMQDRVALVGGALALDHAPGGGARLSVRLPQTDEAVQR